MTTPAVNPDIKPGIYPDIPKDAYHAGPGISKSGLWAISKRTPAHYRFGKRKASKEFDLGEACHLAILEPNDFETKVVRGPDDRRGNKWKDLVEGCGLSDKLLLTSGDYDKTLAIRDAVHADAWINGILTGGEPMIEASGYWIDEETGELCRVRPDFYREDLKIIVDVKTTTNAHKDAFAKSVIDYGYHAQEAIYSDGWRALGKPLDAFVFLAWEKDEPFAYSVFETPPNIVEDGRLLMREALTTYARCKAANHWPAYAEGVQQLEFKPWHYRHTSPDLAEAA